MPPHNKKGRSKNGPPFVQLYRFVKRSQAWHELSPVARCALIELLARYNGKNNGFIVLGARELADELRSSKDTAARALRELDDAGLIRPTYIGAFQGRRASEWCLTFYRDDRNGATPVRNWVQRQSDLKDCAVRSQGRKNADSPISGTQKLKTSTNR